LAEAVALAHDLGHTPFGHAGEEALEICMRPYGGFDHNAQALRIVTKLERRYADYDGLDLTWETLEGIVKHNGPLLNGAAGKPLANFIAEFNQEFDLELHTFASLEAQSAALADDIAYIGHDIDDGLRADLFSLTDLANATTFISQILGDIDRRYPGLERQRIIHELVRRVITLFVENVITTTRSNLTIFNPQSSHEARLAKEAIVAFSDEMNIAQKSIKNFLFKNMYRHEKVIGVWERARDAISKLFPKFMAEPHLMPPDWESLVKNSTEEARAIVVADYIAGMTDRYALGEVMRLYPMDATPASDRLF
jgi:dGTPase